jgi:hypothetical protein
LATGDWTEQGLADLARSRSPLILMMVDYFLGVALASFQATSIMNVGGLLDFNAK